MALVIVSCDFQHQLLFICDVVEELACKGRKTTDVLAALIAGPRKFAYPYLEILDMTMVGHLAVPMCSLSQCIMSNSSDGVLSSALANKG